MRAGEGAGPGGGRAGPGGVGAGAAVVKEWTWFDRNKLNENVVWKTC